MTRRGVLAGGSALGLAVVLSSCADDQPARRAAIDPDDPTVARTVATAGRLRTADLALAGSDRTLRDRYQQFAADHSAHLAALGAPAAQASQSLQTSPGATPSPSAAASSPGEQVSAEWIAGREAYRDAIDAGVPGLAVLLTRIAACRAVHADLLASALGRKALPALIPAERSVPGASASATPSGLGATPTPSTTDTASSSPSSDIVTPDASPTGTPTAPEDEWQQALDRLLAGEHAAVYAYPLVIAQLSGKERDRAQALWLAHQATRNELTEVLVTAGAEPSVAQAAYRIKRPATAKVARRLAAGIEIGLTRLAGDAVAVAEGEQQRTYGADQLIIAARRTAQWSGQPIALPGLPASAGATSSSPASPSAT